MWVRRVSEIDQELRRPKSFRPWFPWCWGGGAGIVVCWKSGGAGFCCAGSNQHGYRRAGTDVIGFRAAADRRSCVWVARVPTSDEISRRDESVGISGVHGTVGPETGDAAGVRAGESDVLERSGRNSGVPGKLNVVADVMPACRAVGANIPVQWEQFN